MEPESVDIVIAGAGPAGATASLFLSKAGVKHIILDKAVFPRDKVCGDALSGKVLQQLSSVNPEFSKELNNLPGKFMESWGVTFVAPNGKALDIPFRSKNDNNPDAPGFISKRTDFDYFLVSKLDKKTADFRQGHELTSIKKNPEGFDLTIRSDTEYHIQCKVLLGAEGAQAVSSKFLGRQNVHPEHYSAGIRAYYSGVSGMKEGNYIELHFLKEFTPCYLWIFPMPAGMANIGVGVLKKEVSARKLNLKTMMLDAIEKNPQLKARFEGAEMQGKIMGWGLPLGSRRMSISGDNFLLLGDAGSLIDPFTGEGIGNGMVSGRIAAETIIKNMEPANFSATVLKEYDDRVFKYLGTELKLSHKLQKLVRYHRLFNFVVNRAGKSKTLSETISAMFEEVDLRAKFRNPLFYLKLLFGK